MADIPDFEHPNLTDPQPDPTPATSGEVRKPRAQKPRPRKSRANHDLTWNVLTVLTWLGMACMAMAFASIYVNPNSLFNPFRPMGARQTPTLVSALILPSGTPSPLPTATLDPLLNTATPSSTPTPATPTVTPTITLTPSATFTPGPSATPTIHSIYPFIQRGDVKMIDAGTFSDHNTCKLWVAGQAYDLQGAPFVGATVMLGGYLDGKTLSQLSLTGTALQYGPAGYEFTIAEQPVKSHEAVWVELFDQAMIPLSGKIYFDTAEDCGQNLILVNFRQVR